MAEQKKYKVLKPSYSQKQNSIDFILEGQINKSPIKVSVDLKKKNGKNPNKWVYLEFHNSKGGDGWLYGACDFVVFETDDNFIFVNRKNLIKYLNLSNLVRWDLPYVDKPWNSKYRLFRRKNTLETITQIKVEDLKSIPNIQIWQKP